MVQGRLVCQAMKEAAISRTKQLAKHLNAEVIEGPYPQGDWVLQVYPGKLYLHTNHHSRRFKYPPLSANFVDRALDDTLPEPLGSLPAREGCRVPGVASGDTKVLLINPGFGALGEELGRHFGRVTLLESDPLLHELTQDGLERRDQLLQKLTESAESSGNEDEKAGRSSLCDLLRPSQRTLSLHFIERRERLRWLRDLKESGERPHTILIDSGVAISEGPSTHPEFEFLLQAREEYIEPMGQAELSELVDEARGVATHRVVVRQSEDSNPPPGLLRPLVSFGGVRFDVLASLDAEEDLLQEIQQGETWSLRIDQSSLNKGMGRDMDASRVDRRCLAEKLVDTWWEEKAANKGGNPDDID